jgi:RHS repeat-associated protein
VLKETYGYDEFGQELYQNQGLQPFTYTGYQKDTITQTYYAQAREYRAQTGRFHGEDRVKGNTLLPVSLNPYTYVRNNPMILVDPDGNEIDWGNINDAIKDFAKNHLFGTSNSIKSEPIRYDGGYYHIESTQIKTEHKGGNIFVANSTDNILNGASINLPSVNTPWGKFGLDGTSVGLNWSDGLALDISVGIDLFSYGIDLTANGSGLQSMGMRGDIGVSVHSEKSRYGLGRIMGLDGDTKLYCFGDVTDVYGTTTHTQYTVEMPTPAYYVLMSVAPVLATNPKLVSVVMEVLRWLGGGIKVGGLLLSSILGAHDIFGNANIENCIE